MAVKRSVKPLIFLGLFLVLLGSIWWLSVPEAQKAPPFSFVGFTNSVLGQRTATFTISNVSRGPILFGPVIEVRGPDGSYERWAGNPAEMPAAPLLANAASTFTTPVPDRETFWRVRLLWQPKPRKEAYGYANTLDRLLRFFRRADYPKGMVPSARVWHDIVLTPEERKKRDAEAGAAPNGAPASNGNSGHGPPSVS